MCIELHQYISTFHDILKYFMHFLINKKTNKTNIFIFIRRKLLFILKIKNEIVEFFLWYEKTYIEPISTVTQNTSIKLPTLKTDNIRYNIQKVG